MLKLADRLWIATTQTRFAGTWFPHTMTVIRLCDGSLMLHSPCRPSMKLLGELRDIGDVAHVVAPNWFHDLYLGEYRLSFPKAIFWGPAFLKQRQPRFIDRRLDDGSKLPWCNELAHVQLKGLLTFDECILFHELTRTLIVADFLFNLNAAPNLPPYTRFAYKITGVDGRLAVFPLLRLLRPLNIKPLRDAVGQLLAWDVELIIVGHGSPVTSAAGEKLAEALRWLRPD